MTASAKTTHQSILKELRNKGFRITNVRRALVDTLVNSRAPLSAIQLKVLVEEGGLTANKTTIYRELSFLLEQAVIHEIDLGDGKKRYESTHHDHHHHLVCVKCFAIEDIEWESDLSAVEKLITKKTGFKVESHTLEFFGTCKKCQSKK